MRISSRISLKNRVVRLPAMNSQTTKFSRSAWVVSKLLIALSGFGLFIGAILVVYRDFPGATAVIVAGILCLPPIRISFATPAVAFCFKWLTKLMILLVQGFENRPSDAFVAGNIAGAPIFLSSTLIQFAFLLAAIVIYAAVVLAPAILLLTAPLLLLYRWSPELIRTPSPIGLASIFVTLTAGLRLIIPWLAGLRAGWRSPVNG